MEYLFKKRSEMMEQLVGGDGWMDYAKMKVPMASAQQEENTYNRSTR